MDTTSKTKKTKTPPVVVDKQQDTGMKIVLASKLNELFPQYMAVMNEPITNTALYSTEWKPGSRGSYLLYITARTAYTLLNTAFGCAWSGDITVMESGKGSAFKATITLLDPNTLQPLGFKRSGVADASDVEAIKGGESDSYKRAMVSLFPAIEALYNGPKVSWGGSGTQPEVWDIYDVLDKIMLLYEAGNILPKRKVLIKKDNRGYYAEYYDYVTKSKDAKAYADGEAPKEEEKPDEKKGDEKKGDKPAPTIDDALKALVGKVLNIEIEVANPNVKGKLMSYSCPVLMFTSALFDKHVKYMESGTVRLPRLFVAVKGEHHTLIFVKGEDCWYVLHEGLSSYKKLVEMEYESSIGRIIKA